MRIAALTCLFASVLPGTDASKESQVGESNTSGHHLFASFADIVTENRLLVSGFWAGPPCWLYG